MTSDELVAAVVRDAALPTGRGQFTDARILEILNEALSGPLYALAMKAREDYFLTYADALVEAGVDRYALPPRAGVGKVASVHFVDASEREQPPLERASPHDSWRWSEGGEPRAFFFQGDELHIRPVPRVAGGYLRMRYYRAPSKLVPLASCARVTAYDDTLGEVTVDAMPAGVAAAPYVDIVRGRAGWGPIGCDMLVNLISGTTVVLSGGLPAPLPMVVGDAGGVGVPRDLAVGDYVCVAEQSPFPWLPTELHQLLAQAAVVEIHRIQSDTQAYALADKAYKEMEVECLALMSAGGGRATQTPKKVAPRMW